MWTNTKCPQCILAACLVVVSVLVDASYALLGPSTDVEG
jgi:hypothetical protein